MRVALPILTIAVALASGQVPQYQQSAQKAAILSDARYLAGDGTFGAAYTQEDGVEFKEESDVEGNRKGSYSYVDPTGQRRTVTYTAGKNGFQASGDHIPTAPPQVAPQPEYVPLPQYNSPEYQQQQTTGPFNFEYRPEYGELYRPPPHLVPQTVFSSQPQFPAQQLGHQQRYGPEPSPQPPQYQSQPFQPEATHRQQTPSQPRLLPQYNSIATPTPHRFYPTGKLDFNRTPDGFSYTFSKQK
ncbi:DNA-directed RNA polymerase II subunit RPB1 isoform X2 [Orussus abietinus]|uniref:DNA-directed RNA polymerase II subunit RPB1 isoform X2 n=1 Tax=Orussus abietinus TaxID=222816 RepID=UPI0006260990|nr:DNA-directed RNA polymerase II subunit RPB1 isoform X2 [Orussus abietinus]